MAEVTQLKRYDARPINWGKWFLIGIGMLFNKLRITNKEAVSFWKCR